jgi:hypothetical protein
MMTVPKGAGTARLKAELEQTVEEEGLQEFMRVYTDGSAMEDRMFGNMRPEQIKISLAEQTCIFNAGPQYAYHRNNKSHQKMGNSEKNCDNGLP